MKTAIIVLVIFYFVLQVWIYSAEQKSKADEEARRQELLKKAREREAWANRHRR